MLSLFDWLECACREGGVIDFLIDDLKNFFVFTQNIFSLS